MGPPVAPRCLLMATWDREVILASGSRGEWKLTSPDFAVYLMPALPIIYTWAIILD